MKKRILIFSLVYLPRYVGGAELAIKELTDRIDYDFDMITLRMDPRLPHVEKIGNVTIYRIGFTFFKELQKYLFPFIGLWQALTLAHSYKYDAVWCMMASYHFMAALFFKLLNPTTPLVLTLQEGDPISHIKRRARPVWPFFKLLFSRATIIQVISKYLGDFAVSMGATCPVEIIPNGADIQNFSRETRVVPFDKKDGEVYLITTSRLVKKNGIEDIITALTLLSSNIKLLILGIGELEGKLRKQVVDLGLTDRVVFVGYVSHKDMPAYLHNTDIFIRPSLSEGFGISFIEAMAAGVPVIATPIGGIVDFLVDGKTGLFCEVKNPQSIADQVNLLLHDRKLYKRLIINGFMMVQDRYTWDIVAREMKEKIFSIL